MSPRNVLRAPTTTRAARHGVAKRRLLVLAAAMASTIVVGGVANAGPGPSAAGGFAYGPNVDGPVPTRSVTVQAFGGEVVHGSYRWTSLSNGTTRMGTITCLVVDGSDAWLAGSETWTNGSPSVGAFIHLHDGGHRGIADDAAVAFIGDPGQSLEELESWCAEQNNDVPLFPIFGGNVTVRP